MSRSTSEHTARPYRGMKRSTRLTMVAGVAVFLTLVSGVSFAAWTASSLKTAAATAGAITVSTENSQGAATITALGPHTYDVSGGTKVAAISVNNTGTVPASVSTLAIARTGAIPGSQIAVKLWSQTTTPCSSTSPSSAISSTLAGGTIDLQSLTMTVAASSFATLCASTTFTGDLTTYAGMSTTATFTLNTAASANWKATDSLPLASRSFTQSVKTLSQLPAPSITGCSTTYRSYFWWFGYRPQATIAWNAPTAPAGTAITYKVYHQSGSTVTLLSTTTSRSVTINETHIQSDGTVTVVASATGYLDSPASSATTVSYSNVSSGGISCGN
ncbi:hypothetical protein [Salinibacterium sp. M195]|uniref:hypothetical protein n=1 Tax=Salinibacterium sp. M195 TaxID=2583374 RepID=UPI001C63231A|nr:hypothetical protein [Salinibacterium sp. M195]QYH35313.1 fibronectin type III domain-containing protein [Salinibacterium sp. M195]